MTVGWGFIGASIWARTKMIPAVHAVPGARAVGVYSTSADRGARLAHEAELEHAYPTLDALLADPAVDAVYVGTTNDLHAQQTLAAANAGKHVLCEKPLALSLDDALRMKDACAAAGVVLGTNHHLRGAPAILRMKELVAQGQIGDVVAVRVFHSTLLPEAMRTWRLDRPEAGAGVVLDLTVHDADTVRFLLDDEVEEVTAMVTNQGMASADVEDSAMGILRMWRGQLVSFHDAFTLPHAGTGIEVHGTAGSLFGRGILSAEPVGEVIFRRFDQDEVVNVPRLWPLYENVIRHFDAAVRGEGEPLTSGDDGLASLAVALAVRESASHRCSVTPRFPLRAGTG